MIMVNGNTWPFQTVEQRRYRFRFLNGCQSRFLILDFSQIPGVEVWQIGNEGGFLAAPVNLTADHGNRLLMGLAERADVIVDFTHVPVGNYVLRQRRPGRAVRRRRARMTRTSIRADPDTTGQIMQFRVVPAAAPDPTTPPQFLVLPAHHAAAGGTLTRPLALIEMMSRSARRRASRGRCSALWTRRHGRCTRCGRTRSPRTRQSGDTEVWEFYNFTADAHPMHIHEVAFEVVNRQALRLRTTTRMTSSRSARWANRDRSRSLGDRVQGHRHRLPGRGHPRAGQVRHAGPVRLALPHRRARGQRDDAALPHRPGTARTAHITGCVCCLPLVSSMIVNTGYPSFAPWLGITLRQPRSSSQPTHATAAAPLAAATGSTSNRFTRRPVSAQTITSA